jgi:hypothetical protein
MLHRGLLISSKEEMLFPSCNFCLKKCLDEPTQFKTRLQFEQAQQPVRTNPWLNFTPMEQGVMGKLARIVTCAFGAWHSHVRTKRCYGSQNKQGWFYQGHYWHSGITRGCDTITCLCNGRKGWKGFPYDSKEFKALSGLYRRNWGVKGITL